MGCSECRYFISRPDVKILKDENELWGQCRRFPPQPKVVNAGISYSVGYWSLITSDGWCGEFETEEAHSPEDFEVSA